MPKIYNVTANNWGIKKVFRLLVINADPVTFSQAISEQIPAGWRIEHVSEGEEITKPAAFVLSVTEIV